MAHDLVTHAFTPEATTDVNAPVYVIRDTGDVGIGNRTFFSTEQHPKKLSDTVGMLTLHATQYKNYQDAENNCCPQNVTVKCTKVPLVLCATVSKNMAVVLPYKGEMRDYINKHVHRCYTNNSLQQGYGSYESTASRSKKEQVRKRPGEAEVVAALSDALYVLHVNVCAEPPEVLSEWDRQSAARALETPSKKSSKDAANRKRQEHVLEKYLCDDTVQQPQYDKLQRTSVALPKSPTSSARSCQVEISFSRTDDVPMIMQAMHYFVKSVNTTNNSAPMTIKFANGQIPGWVHMHYNTAPDYRKTRSIFSNEEAVDKILSTCGWHFSTWFTLNAEHIRIKKKMRMQDATWSNVIFTEFDKLELFHDKSPLVQRKVFGTRVAVDRHAMRERDRRQSQATTEDYTRHQEELSRRLRWCIDRGESFWPAHEKVHLAPGDDSQFVLGVAPWMSDGLPNPLGIPDKQMIEGPPTGFEMMLE